MKDSLGNELSIGDKVAFVTCDYENKFRSVDTGIVAKMCPYMCKITNTSKGYHVWRSSGPRYETYRKYNRIIKL